MTQKKVNLNLIGWLLYIGYTALGSYIEQEDFHVIMLSFSFLLTRFVVFYFCYIMVYPLFMKQGKTLQLIAGILAAFFLFILLRYLLEENLYPALFGFSNYRAGTSLLYYFTDNLYYAFPSIIISAAVWGFESALQKERENRTLRQEKIQAELAFLKTQINPHFLYNTLNYIYSLAYPVSDKLADAVIKLSGLMRYMLYESKDGKVELQKEVDYLQNYIDIYRLRFGDNFFVNFNIQGHVNGQRVPSLVLIPFVENALKHGVVDNPTAPVSINMQLADSSLYFEVSNRINQSQKDATTGIGLPNIRRRLDLLYPGKYTLEIKDDGHTYHTMLKLQNLSESGFSGI